MSNKAKLKKYWKNYCNRYSRRVDKIECDPRVLKTKSRDRYSWEQYLYYEMHNEGLL